MTTKASTTVFHAFAVVAVLATASFAASALPNKTETVAPAAHYNAFSCVRPSYTENWRVGSGGPYLQRDFAGLLPCREQLPLDKDGYVVFPEA